MQGRICKLFGHKVERRNRLLAGQIGQSALLQYQLGSDYCFRIGLSFSSPGGEHEVEQENFNSEVAREPLNLAILRLMKSSIPLDSGLIFFSLVPF